MYIRIFENIVQELIPDFVDGFPDVPVQERYAPDFLSTCIHVPDETPVKQGDKYDERTRTFHAPEGREDLSYIEIIQKLESEVEQSRADLDYIAAITGVIL